jgi:hypothetical protein
MAHFLYPRSSAPATFVHLAVGQTIEFALWGGGPNGENLDVKPNDSSVVRIDRFFPPGGIPGPNMDVFQLTGLKPGTAMLEARIPGGPLYAAPAQIIVQAVAGAGSCRFFYHGTSLEQARRFLTMDLSPMAVLDSAALDWWEYTDFGKGFYTHPEESKKKAVEWAKRKNQEWGVVRFSLTKDEFAGIPGSPLHFQNKRNHRPPNAPILFNSQAANWIEFVEFNRGIRPSAQRPKDNDWTSNYCWMRGPIWGRVDSGMPGGGPPIPDHIQQINWGRAGLTALNAEVAKRRRFLFNKDNEHLLEQPVGQGSAGGGGKSGGAGASGSW